MPTYSNSELIPADILFLSSAKSVLVLMWSPNWGPRLRSRAGWTGLFHTSGAVIDECGALVEWRLPGENRGTRSKPCSSAGFSTTNSMRLPLPATGLKCSPKLIPASGRSAHLSFSLSIALSFCLRVYLFIPFFPTFYRALHDSDNSTRIVSHATMTLKIIALCVMTKRIWKHFTGKKNRSRSANCQLWWPCQAWRYLVCRLLHGLTHRNHVKIISISLLKLYMYLSFLQCVLHVSSFLVWSP